jgi:ribosome-binding protein aMBF1 (putative translation factor)
MQEQITKEERQHLEAQGYKFVTPAEFLGLTPEDEEWIEMKLRLSRLVRQARAAQGLTQAQLAARLGSGQARISRIESGAQETGFDLLMRAALALGLTSRQIAQALAGGDLNPAH